jgi:hypothetical protein
VITTNSSRPLMVPWSKSPSWTYANRSKNSPFTRGSHGCSEPRYQQSAAARYSVVILFGKWFLGFAAQKGIGDGVAQELGRSGYDFFVSCDSKIGIGELQIGLVECRFVDQLRNGGILLLAPGDDGHSRSDPAFAPVLVIQQMEARLSLSILAGKMRVAQLVRLIQMIY